MTVLLTNSTLDFRAGTELYVRDLALELLRRGHRPVAFSTRLGEVAREIESAGVPVVATLETLTKAPDIIHGHHHIETLIAMLSFPETPAISYCHGAVPWEEAPLRFPRIRKYVAVSTTAKERLMSEGGIRPDQIRLIGNFFDERRFPPRGPLPARPSRALAFGNTFSETAGLPVLREACKRHGIGLDAAGKSSGHSVAPVGELLAGYDLVFAVGRSAIEAMAVGAAVVVCGESVIDRMVTNANFHELRADNFVIGETFPSLTVDRATDAVAGYDAADAGAVCRLVRERCEMRGVVDEIVALYEDVLEEARQSPRGPSADCDRAVAGYLLASASRFKSNEAAAVHAWFLRASAAEAKSADLEHELDGLRRDRSRWVARSLGKDHSLARVRRARQRAAAALPPMPVIVGSPRSGTTLLRFMLDSHPLLAIPPETGFLTQALAIQGDGAAARNTVFGLITGFPESGPTWDDFGLRREDLLASLESVEPFEIADGFRAFYRLYANRHKKLRYGDKTPLYCEHLDAIRKVLPEARFIHIVRDGRDAALSLRSHWFAPGKDIAALAANWRRQVSAARAAGLGRSDYFEVKFEHLVARPESALRAVCEFIELPFHPNMLAYFERTPERLKEHVTRRTGNGDGIVTHEERLDQHRLTMEPPREDRAYRWKEDMGLAERHEFLEVAGDLLEELGYDV